MTRQECREELFDNRVSALLEEPRHIDPERFRRLEIYSQLELGGLLNWHVCRFVALQNFMYKKGAASKQGGAVCPYDIKPPTSAKARVVEAAGKRCSSARSAKRLVDKLPWITRASACSLTMAAKAASSSSSGPRIPLRLENPKIGRVDDAEIVGDRIAEDGPVFRHLHAQEMQNGSAEVVVARVASVVGHVAMHQPP